MTADEQAQDTAKWYALWAGKPIEEILQLLPSSYGGGSGHFHFLKEVLLVRTAEMVNKQLAEAASNLAKASTDLQTASAQSSRIGAKLNVLTGALLFAAVVTAGATTFQACQTERQVDLIEKQILLQSSRSQPATPASPLPETNRSQSKQ